MQITIPDIPTEELSQLDRETTLAVDGELAAIKVLRERFGPLAKYNGVVKIRECSTNYGTHLADYIEEFLENEGGQKVRAFRIVNNYETTKHTDFTGTEHGYRLYLTPAGWIELTRSGNWSHWEKSTSGWIAEVREMTDEQVADEYDLDGIIRGLSKALNGLQDRIPDKFRRVRERASLAENIVKALAEG
jgi:hypothetical protein